MPVKVSLQPLRQAGRTHSTARSATIFAISHQMHHRPLWRSYRLCECLRSCHRTVQQLGYTHPGIFKAQFFIDSEWVS